MTENRDAAAALLHFNQQLLSAALQPLWQGSGIDTSEILKSLTASVTQDAGQWRELQQRYYRDQLDAWTRLATADPTRPGSGGEVLGDRRFRAPEWRQPYFTYLAESYLA